MRVISAKLLLLFVSAWPLLPAGPGNLAFDQGVAAFRDGRYSAALEQLQQAVKKEPENVSARVFLALTQAAKGDCVAAMPDLVANLHSSDEKLARLDGIALARCQESGGSTDQALKTLTDLNRRFPNDADVIYVLAKLHMKGFNDATFQMFQRAASSYRVHQLSAEIFEVQGRFDEAVDEYRKAIALNASAPDLHFRLGRALLMRSHSTEALEQARQEFQAELKTNPEDAATEFQLGQIAQVENKADEARSHLQRALQLNPSFPEALVAFGRVESQQKQYKTAIEFFSRATTLQPENESAHYALMMAYRDSGQPDKAKSEKAILDRLQRPPEGEFTQFLKKLGERPAQQ